MWHRPLLHVSYLPIQVLKTSLSDPEFQSEKQMALANDVVQYFISLIGKKVRKVRIIRDIMYVLHTII